MNFKHALACLECSFVSLISTLISHLEHGQIHLLKVPRVSRLVKFTLDESFITLLGRYQVLPTLYGIFSKVLNDLSWNNLNRLIIYSSNAQVENATMNDYRSRLNKRCNHIVFREIQLGLEKNTNSGHSTKLCCELQVLNKYWAQALNTSSSVQEAIVLWRQSKCAFWSMGRWKVGAVAALEAATLLSHIFHSSAHFSNFYGRESPVPFEQE